MSRKLRFLLVMIFIISRSSAPEKTILGKWKEIDKTEVIQFYKDGTVNVIDKGISLGGSFKCIDHQHIKMELGSLGVLAGPMVYTVSVSKDELTLTDSRGKVSRYRRLK